MNSGRRGEEILLGARKPVLNRQHCFDGGSNDVATKERARADLLSILTGLAGPSSLARFFERLAVLRFALRVARPRVAIFNSMERAPEAAKKEKSQ